MQLRALSILLVGVALNLNGQATATISPLSLRFTMTAGRWPASQRLTIAFSVNYQPGSTFRVKPWPIWLQLLNGMGPATTSFIPTQSYDIEVSPRGDRLTTAGEYTANIGIELNSGKVYEIPIAVSVAAAPPAPVRPQITAVTSAAFYALAGFAPNSLVTIYGQRLAPSTQAASSIPLPKKLLETEVQFCRRTFTGTGAAARSCSPMELVFVSPNQINFLLKYSYIDSGPAGIVVSSAGTIDTAAAVSPSAFTTLYLNWISPGAFAAGFDCPVTRDDVPCDFSSTRTHTGQVLRATITDSNYRLVTSSNSAKVDEDYVIWLTGLGLDGQVGDLRPRLEGLRLRLALQPPERDLRSVADSVLTYAGASETFPGLYQINFRIPADVARVSGACTSGRAELWLTLFGATLSGGMPLPIRAHIDDRVCQ